jgi:hypothetical protein
MEYMSTAKWRERRIAYPILKGSSFVFNIPKKDNMTVDNCQYSL